MPGILRVDQANVDYIYAKTAGNTTYIPGHIIQVVNTYINTPQSQSVSGSFATYNDIANLTATITPKSVNSKIYITVRWFGEFGSTDQVYNSMYGLKRNGTVIGLGSVANLYGIHTGALTYTYTDADSTPETCFFDYYDTPASISALTYQVYICVQTAQTLYTNRVVNASSASSPSYERGTSSISLFEIAG